MSARKPHAPARAGAAFTFNDRQEATLILRRILAAVDRGELDALDRAGRRLVHRLEGATAALKVDAPTP